MTMRLHWHRQDLRGTDNTALAWAADHGDVLPVFIFDNAILEHGSPARVRFMLDALAELRKFYRDRGGDLLIRQGNPATVLPDLCLNVDANGALWNRDYSGLARDRDRAVKDALSEANLERQSFHDDIHHEPGSITTNKGDPYSVYTYFWKKWQDRAKADPHSAPNSVVDPTNYGTEAGELPSIETLGFEEASCDVEPAGYQQARKRLDEFCNAAVYSYDDRRDYPADDNTSRLSAHLTWGTIGVREVYAATENALMAAETETERENVKAYQSQLAWREFYTHVLYFNPGVVTQNYKEYEHEIAWRDDSDELAAWKQGETGYPIVDAGMRQLLQEGYMHNRVRMIVASFLTKDLLIDWREGYDHFRTHLVDHDTANDNGGWQWAASTGTDAQPYFRIFNPMTQGERYDPDAEYIRQFVPELTDATPDQIHSWHELSLPERKAAAPEYPNPIVQHSQRREDALTMFEEARGDD
jgi:deoxyribodipyrimidine photo-lyase